LRVCTEPRIVRAQQRLVSRSRTERAQTPTGGIEPFPRDVFRASHRIVSYRSFVATGGARGRVRRSRLMNAFASMYQLYE
jgi:hypothetical protein